MIQVNSPLHKQQMIPFLFISTFILLAFGIIAYLDSDTSTIANLFATENLVGLAVYFIPTILVCILLYRRYKKKSSMTVSIAKSVALGIPLCFISIIALLITLKLVGAFG